MYKDEFPDYDDELWIPDGFKDESWHNDVCPHVEKEIEDFNGAHIQILIWQDYKDPEKREYSCASRYMLVINVNGDDVFIYSTDNFDELERIVTTNLVNGYWEH